MNYQWIKWPSAKWIAGVIIMLFGIGAIAAPGKITVFAAASLTNALHDIAKHYQQEKQIEVVGVYASSSTLARQIDQGAPAALFISANQQWMDYLAQKQVILTTHRDILLGNELVLIVPTNSLIQHVNIDQHTDWKKLLNGGRLAVGDPDHVPVGIYAKQALEYVAAWSTVAPEMARANNVRGALALVERAEAPLGIVYRSDALATDKVRIAGVFAPQSYQPIEYSMAIIKDHNSPIVSAFYDYLKSPAVAAIFKRHGFIPRYDVE